MSHHRYSHWGYGVSYQGYRYTLTTAVISCSFAAVIAGLLVRLRGIPTARFSLTVNLLLFAWAFTYAFPYLGELP